MSDHGFTVFMCSCLALLVFLAGGIWGIATIQARQDEPETNKALTVSYAEFADLDEAEQLDACIPVVRSRFGSTWNRWLNDGLSPVVGKVAYLDEVQPTANGLLNLTSIVLKIIEEEPDMNTAQNLVTCAYNPTRPQYFETISLVAGGRLIAPRCSLVEQDFMLPVSIEDRWRSIERRTNGKIEYGLEGNEFQIWRLDNIKYPQTQTASSAPDGVHDIDSAMCEPIAR